MRVWRLILCALLGHQPENFLTTPMGTQTYLMEVKWKNGPNSDVRIRLCQRCGTVYWEKCEEG